MGTLHQLPTLGKGIQSQVSPAERLAIALRQAVDAEVDEGANFEAREAAALRLSNEATQVCLQNDLQMMADEFSDRVEIDGRVFRPVECGTVPYHSLCGRLEVKRWIHREVGDRNGATVVPLELAAGLAECTTPALAHRIALGYAKGHMRGCAEDMLADHRSPPSRSTLERVAVALGTNSREHAKKIEAHIRRSEGLPQGAVAVSLGLDRTSVPMEEDLADDSPSKDRKKERAKPYQRQKPNPVEVNYRMAYVGTVTAHGADGEALVTRRYAAGNDEDPTRVGNQMASDLHRWLQLDCDLAVGIVQDGAPEMWNILRTALNQEPLVDDWYETIDRYHLNERLADVLKLIEQNPEQRSLQLSRWNDSLDANDNAIYRIRQWVRDKFSDASNNDNQQLADGLKPHLTYLENNAHFMRYSRVIEAGLPIGSGATEGACKSVIELRTNGSGQRWRPKGLHAVLTLRSIYMSGRLTLFWSHLSRRYRKEVRKAA